MPQRSPCEYYLKYLVVHPDRLTDDDIGKLVRAQQLDFIGPSYLQQLRAKCKPPNPFYPEKKNHRQTTRFLLKEKLEAIFQPDPDMFRAMRFLDKPRAKELIESMAIAGSTTKWIHVSLKRAGFDSTEQAVEYYLFYYFNLSLVDSNELQAFMMHRCDSPVTMDPGEQRLNEHYARAMLRSERVQAANMAVTPYAGLLSLLRRGIMPSNVQISRIVSATRLTATIKADEALLEGKSGMSRDYAIVAKAMSEILQETGEVEEGLQEGLSRLVLKTDERRLPNVKQLSGGHHTLDLQPPIDTEGEPVHGEPVGAAAPRKNDSSK